VLSGLIARGSVCFDIGAAHGTYAVFLSKIVGPTGRVHCFEPNPHNYKVLRTITNFCRLKNIVAFEKALSDHEGIETLAIPIKRPSKIFPGLGHALAHLATPMDVHCAKTSVVVTTLDRYISQNNFTRLDFIKCDAEGAELMIFRGGVQTIQRFRPLILCEVYKVWLERFGATRDQIRDFFAGLGYAPFILEGDKISAVNSLDEDRNYFFIPL